MAQVTRPIPIAIVFLALMAVVSNCDRSHPSGPLAAGSYITIAMQSSEGKAAGLELFPRKPGAFKCVIGGGGLAPGIWVPGTCTTRVYRHSDDKATVRFVESWSARRFRTGSGQRGQLSHTWELTLSRDAAGDHVVGSRDYGDFPPQLVRRPPLDSNPNLAPPRAGGGSGHPPLGA
jgi:hypothetical protein